MVKKYFFYRLTVIIILILSAFALLLRIYSLQVEIETIENQNAQLRSKDTLHAIDIANILAINMTSLDHDIVRCLKPNSIHLYVKSPICASCLIEVCRELNDYAQKTKKRLLLFCESKYKLQIQKMLRFEAIPIVPETFNSDSINSNLTLAFTQNDIQTLFVPLPVHREANFIRAFIKMNKSKNRKP